MSRESSGGEATDQLCEFVQLYPAGAACVYQRGKGIVAANDLCDAPLKDVVLSELNQPREGLSNGLRSSFESERFVYTTLPRSDPQTVVCIARNPPRSGGARKQIPLTAPSSRSHPTLHPPPRASLSSSDGVIRKRRKTDKAEAKPISLPSDHPAIRDVTALGVEDGGRPHLRDADAPPVNSMILDFMAQEPAAATTILLDEAISKLPKLPRTMKQQGPRAEAWLERWAQIETASVSRDEQRDFVQLYREIDWSQSLLGPLDEWPELLLAQMSLALASPHPVLIAYGPELCLLYNVSYSRNVAEKHPIILGLPYSVAWSEVWAYLHIPAKGALSGKSHQADNDHLYLRRADYLEECFFSWSMSPMWDDQGKIVGIWIPNYDNTKSVVTERRVRLLREASLSFSINSSPASLFNKVCNAVSNEAIDVPLLVFYDCSAADDERDISQDSSHEHSILPGATASEADVDAATTPNGNTRSSGRDTYTVDEEVPVASVDDQSGAKLQTTFIRAAVFGTSEDCKVLPPEIPPAGPDGREMEGLSHPSFLKVFREVQRTHKRKVLHGKDIADYIQYIDKTVLGDQITCLIVMPLLTMDNNLRAIGIMGTNPRKKYDEDYDIFVDLFQAQVSHGITSIRLVNEEIRRSRFFAALIKRKNEELHQLLDARTEELRSSELKFLKMAEMSPAGIYTASLDGEITFVNEAWWKLSGHPREKHPSQWLESVEDEDKPLCIAAWKDILQGEMTSIEFRWRKHSGQTRNTWVYIVNSPEFDEDGKLCAVSGVATDITSKKTTEEYEKNRAEEAIELRRQQERFIDMTSHEMRNPLSAICLAADASAERLEALTGSDQAKTSLASIKAEVADTLSDLRIINHCTVHMSRLIDDTLTLSKLDNDFLVVTPVPCRPVDFIPETLSVFKAEMASKGIMWELEMASGFKEMNVDWVLTDPSRINQLLINLLTNAIKFTAQSRSRIVRVICNVVSQRPKLFIPHAENIDERVASPPLVSPRQMDSIVGDLSPELYLVCSVSDTGRGLTAQEMSGLFQRFKQANAKTHVMYGGSGLGLFICRRIVELFGGEIGVESVRGTGSTFTFYVPTKRSENPLTLGHTPSPSFTRMNDTSLESAVAFPMMAAPQIVPNTISPVSTPPVTSGNEVPDAIHVLIVEDNIVNQRLLDKNLARSGCVTSCANHGEEAIEKLQASQWVTAGGSRIDCVLMDIEMPVLDGLSAIKIIRQMQRDGQINGHIPILAVSANARQEQIDTMIQSGFDGSVSKPFKIGNIIEKMKATVQSMKSKQSSV